MIGSLPPVKGISPYMAGLVQALGARDDVDVEVIGFESIYPAWLYPGGEPAESGRQPYLAGVVVRNLLKWYDPLSWIRAGLELRGDVVHAQWWSFVLAPAYITVLAIARLRGKRVVLTVHNVAPHEEGAIRRSLNAAVLRCGHRVIVHSENNRTALRVEASRRPVVVVPHGRLDPPRSGLTRPEARGRLGLSNNGAAQVVLAFGNIRPYKGIDVLLKAFASVLKERPRAVLVIAGKAWTSWEPYAALIARLGIQDGVRLFLDFIPADQVETFFTAADVVVLPYTHFDGQSGVGNVALPFGRPLVVSDVGGLADLVVSEDVVVAPGDAEALATALVQVLSDIKLRRRLAADSRRLARRFDWGPIAESTVEIYRQLLNRDTGEEQAA